MLTPNTVQDYVRAQPFQPFCIRMASGRTYEIRHPEMIKVLKSYALVFRGGGDVPEEHETISLMLSESIAPLEVTSR